MAAQNPASDDLLVAREESLPIILEPEPAEESALELALELTPDQTEKVSTMKEIQVPEHPIPAMQGAFAESLMEASGQTTPTLPKATSNSADRRAQLLAQDITEETHASRWRQKPGQHHHELWKLMAQISFGIYLLLNAIAKDDEQVLNILQGHVDEVDEFLEITLEDFDLAQEDIDERIRVLKIPLDNIEIFDAMLEDRQYRNDIVKGNERIEHIIHRTASAMTDALKDVQQGLDATKEFAKYLAEEQEKGLWKVERPDMQKVYEAMKGNVDGWSKAYISLQTKGNHLGVCLVQLASICAELDRRAAEVSRKLRFSLSPENSNTSATTSPPTSPQRSSHHSKPSVISVTKELPPDAMITPAIRATLPAFQYVSEREISPERSPTPESLEDGLPESESEFATFTLQPRTYSPAPVPRAPVQQPTPEPEPEPVQDLPQRASLRQRLSLKRKAIPSVLTSPPPTVPQPKRPEPVTHHSYGGQDSAYCSDTDRIASRTESMFDDYRPAPKPPSNFDSPFVSSPRSDQQTFFRPVQASPHSPLQRPWTAAPLLAESNLRHSSGTMLSTVSTIAMENGKQVKKKKSGFGWLKKAFSLSEEEKAEFEAKRRQAPPPEYTHPPRQFLDGKRLR